MYGVRPGAPDGRVALTILESLHNRVVAATPGKWESALYCRYLYMILVQDHGKKVPHSVFHEIVGVLGSFVKPCEILQELGKKDIAPPGFASMVIHLEILLTKFLEHIAWAIHVKDNKNHKYLFSNVIGHRNDLVGKLRRITHCLEQGFLPSAQGNVADIAGNHYAPLHKDGTGGWDFDFSPERTCIGCNLVPDWKIRMVDRLGYVPDGI